MEAEIIKFQKQEDSAIISLKFTDSDIPEESFDYQETLHLSSFWENKTNMEICTQRINDISIQATEFFRDKKRELALDQQGEDIPEDTELKGTKISI